MNITESDVATWLIDQARKGLTGTVDMGALEKIVEEVSREMPAAGAGDLGPGDGSRAAPGLPDLRRKAQRRGLRP